MSIYLVGIIGLFRKLCFREVIFDEILNLPRPLFFNEGSE